MKRFVVFDGENNAVGFCQSPNNMPTSETIKYHGGITAKLESTCSRNEIEQATRSEMDDRKYEGRRRRSGGHGYTEGDGFKVI